MTEASPGKPLIGTTLEVKAMYEAHPYPSPIAGGSLIEDVANSLYSLFGDDSLRGKYILDAGCGTGHRLVAVARMYPDAHFVGLDMTRASLEVARSLAQKHRVRNVEFHAGDLLNFQPQNSFDLIVSVGVVHHLENPCQGIQALGSLLKDSGTLLVWLYHSLGEHARLVDRELLLTLWDRASGIDEGLRLLRNLGSMLETQRYGSSAAQANTEISQISIDVDAFLHPIVHAYRFDDALEMFRNSARFVWASINNINLPASSKLVDINEVEKGDVRHFCQTVEGLFEDESLRQRFRALGPREKLRILELRLKPTGFTILGGRGDSYEFLTPRAKGNTVSLDRGA
jgi:SAM-dependent methyltransferase